MAFHPAWVDSGPEICTPLLTQLMNSTHHRLTLESESVHSDNLGDSDARRTEE